MITTSKITMDLNGHTISPVIHVMQDDRYCRNLELSLLLDSNPWEIPEDVSVLLRYSKPDGTGGTYDTLPDGTKAWSAAENMLTVALAPQVLTVAGAVSLTVSLIQQQAQISLFSIILNVKPVAHREMEDSEEYVYVTEFLPAPRSGQPGQYLRITAVNEQGHVTELEAADLQIDGNEVRNSITAHNNTDTAHPDIRQRLDLKLGTDSIALSEEQKTLIRENIGMEELLSKTEEIVIGINLNDGVYETGRFNAAGEEYDAEGAYGIRSVNYLPVEGGRSISAYYDPAPWNGNTGNYSIQVVQYDRNFTKIGGRGVLSNLLAIPTSCLTLDADTAYIRIDYNSNGTAMINDLTAPKIAVYYREDALQEFVEYNKRSINTTLWIDKARIRDLDPLSGKTIIYDGDSIAESRTNNGGGYAGIIAEMTGGSYVNNAVSGSHLRSGVTDRRCLADCLEQLPKDGDLYCFQAGINDFWGNAELGVFDASDYTSSVDASTICGAMETIFRYMLNNLPDVPVCFVITHKVQDTAYRANTAGNTFQDYRDVMAAICEKYSVPYYDAFNESGLNGWSEEQNSRYMTANSAGTPDGCHPNAAGYKRGYVPQLLALFRRIMPAA